MAGLERAEGVVLDVVGQYGINIVALQAVIGAEVSYGFQHIGVKIFFPRPAVRAQRYGDRGSGESGELPEGLQRDSFEVECGSGRVSAAGQQE